MCPRGGADGPQCALLAAGDGVARPGPHAHIEVLGAAPAAFLDVLE